MREEGTFHIKVDTVHTNFELVECVLNIYKVACIISYLLIYYYPNRVVCQETGGKGRGGDREPKL